MKYALATCVFILGLSWGIQSTAAEPAATGHEAATTTCTAENSANCAADHMTAADHSAHTAAAGQHGPATAAKDWSNKRQQQVSAIFPPRQPIKALATRPEKVKTLNAQVNGAAAKLEWSEVTGATNYHVQVSKDAGFNNRSMYVTDDKWVKGTSFEVSNLEAGQKYFWRVAAVNSNNDPMFTKSLFNFSSFIAK